MLAPYVVPVLVAANWLRYVNLHCQQSSHLHVDHGYFADIGLGRVAPPDASVHT